MTAHNAKPAPSTSQPPAPAGEPTWPGTLALPQAPITIVGLGPGPLEAMTLAAWQTLRTASRLVLRTARHPCVAAFPPDLVYTSFDALYEQHATFAQVYDEIAQQVVAWGHTPQGVVYAVPGHPWVGEATTPLILAAAHAAGLAVHVVEGLSFVEPCLAAVGVDLMDGAQVLDAMLLAQQHHPKLDPGLPLLVGQVYSRQVASDLKLTLLNAYPDEHPLRVLRGAGGPQMLVQELPLHALDQEGAFDHLTSVYVPPVAAGASFSHLQEIVARLRAPDGCPWDRRQTLDSLKQDLLGECVEVLEAIDLESADGQEDNSSHIGEELGDLLLVAVMLVQIATEEGRFKMGDVTQGIVEKLIRRHPHVFGETVVDSVGQVLSNWDAIKAQEKADKGQAAAGPLAGVPALLPALEKARVLQSKAEKAGLLRRADLAKDAPRLFAQFLDAAPTAKADVLGAFLWSLVALAHSDDLNAEDALRAFAVAFRAGREGVKQVIRDW